MWALIPLAVLQFGWVIWPQVGAYIMAVNVAIFLGIGFMEWKAARKRRD